MKQKGMEMPIQIFITLFVLLAVAILILTLVQEQFSKSTGDLEEQERRQDFQRSISMARVDCQNLCGNSCDSDQRKASYCISTVSSELNLSKDEEAYDKTYLAGTGLCEDQVYCAQIYDCDCGGSILTMKACKENILCSFWKDSDPTGAPVVYANSQLAEFIKGGTCFDPLDPQADHWIHTLYQDTPGVAGGFVCT